MKLGNDLIRKKFDDIDGKIDFMIELCRRLQLENEELMLKVKGFEAELENTKNSKKQFSGHEALIQSKIDGFLTKLDSFSNSMPGEYSSNL